MFEECFLRLFILITHRISWVESSPLVARHEENSEDFHIKPQIWSIVGTPLHSHKGANRYSDFQDVTKISPQQVQSLLSEHYTAKALSIYASSSPTDRPLSPGKITERGIRRYNSSGMDISGLNSPLIDKNGQINKDRLRVTPHGRHLLLISLLEHLNSQYWKLGCLGYLQFYLPAGLRSPDQPDHVPPTAYQLQKIEMNGREATREELVALLDLHVNSVLPVQARFSRYNSSHVAAVGSLVYLAMTQASFDQMLTFLVVAKGNCNARIFTEALYTIIDSRGDVGFVVPSFTSLFPGEFFPIPAPGEVSQSEDSLILTRHPKRRLKRQLNTDEDKFIADQIAMKGDEDSENSTRVSFRNRTFPPSEPEGQLWYFREDPKVNTHHAFWHSILSNRGSETANMNRRGEMFFFMHRQMLVRYNIDRLSNDLPPVEAFNSSRWNLPVSPGYNPGLHTVGGYYYEPRLPEHTLKDSVTKKLIGWENEIKNAIRNGTIQYCVTSTNCRNISLQYSGGTDLGISPLSDVVESWVHGDRYGSLHNIGHNEISMMSNNGGRNVMVSSTVSMRDPIFHMWHKHIDDILRLYKSSLGNYSDEDLDFAGVEVSSFGVDSLGVKNNLTTFTQFVRHELTQDFTRMLEYDITRVIEYEILNHIPFQYNISIVSKLNSTTNGVGRIFLMPANITLGDNTTGSSQLAVEMDRFLVKLQPGVNKINRSSSNSSFTSAGPPSLRDIQSRIIKGEMSEVDFNWASCGWPQELTLPRGKPGGMNFTLVFILSPVLEVDRERLSVWESVSGFAWSWCGVRKGKDVPDSRPMGFPYDRDFPPDLMLRNSQGMKRGNMASVLLTIHHKDDGTVH